MENERDYERGWQRFGLDTLDLAPARIHGGGADVDMALAIDRGRGKPFAAYVVIAPGDGDAEAPPIGLHIHRGPTGNEVEEWYVIIDGTGVQRFTNGDSVEFGPGDLIAVYPGTGHSLEVTGDKSVKLLAIMPEHFVSGPGEHPQWPDTWKPRIRVLTVTEQCNPLTAECAVCGKTWLRPDDDFGSNTLATWLAEHECVP